MIKKKSNSRALLYATNYKIIIELYHLNKTKVKCEAKLPVNDVRRIKVRRMITNEKSGHIISLRKALLKIAALW
jgi:hypothetical protein